jgi:phosphatidate cytidylyltransferase
LVKPTNSWKRNKKVLKQRIITALILAPLAVWGVFGLSTRAFAVFIGVVVVLAGWEWANLSGWSSQAARWSYAVAVAGLLALSYGLSPLFILIPALVWWLLAFFLIIRYPDSSRWWGGIWPRALIGLMILVPAWKGLIILHGSVLAVGTALAGAWIILYVFCTVWAADVGAYFAGRAWGKAKLAPNVSPGKSWAGVYGGLVCVTVLALLTGLYLQLSYSQLALLIVVTLITAAVSVVGDLSESMLKRFRGIKDSSQLLPGHGGILDRVDSITAAVPVFTVMALGLGWLG